MVEFQDPAVVEKDFVVLVKLWHVLNGIFIWEFFVTLNYEWSVIRGHRPYRWSIWIYSLTRVCTLIAVALNMLGFDSSSPINCQLWVVFEFIFAYSAFAAASTLIVLRIIAIWGGNRIAMAIAICSLSSNIAFFIHNIAVIHATWAPTQSVCEVLNPECTTKTIIAVLVSDVILLLTMLVGLLRLRHDGTMFGLGLFLWKQGLMWLFLATVAGVPPAVFICLNLNYPFDLMFQTPALIVMSIGATRIHRSLTDFTDSGSQVFEIYPTRKGRMAITSPNQIFEAPIPLDRVEVVFPSPPANIGQYRPDCEGSRLQDKHLVLNIGNDLESGVTGG